MAANLLLEGPDLEALLLRAHQEGGAQARIVRAEKIRRGGVLGFFAREGFEVAVELPENTVRDAAHPDAAHPDAHPDAASAPSPGSPSLRAPVAQADPIPAGLMGLADRVSDEERQVETVSRVPEFRYAEAALGEIPVFEPAVFPEHESWPVATTTTPNGLRRPEPEPEPETEPAIDRPREQPAGAASDDVSTPLRPPFTALIDQLRVGVRDGRHREEGVRHTADHPVVAALHAGLTEEHDTSTAHIVSALEAEAWAQVRTAATAEPLTPGTDETAMPEPAADASPEAQTHPFEPYHEDPVETVAHDQADPEEQAMPQAHSPQPSNRNATIVPSRPVKRSRRGVPAQRHVEPEQSLEQVLQRASDPEPVPVDDEGPDAEPLHPVEEQPEVAEERVRKAAWWRLGTLRRQHADQASELWTPEDDERLAADTHWSADPHVPDAEFGAEFGVEFDAQPDIRFDGQPEVAPSAGVPDIPTPARSAPSPAPVAGFTAAAMSGRPPMPAAATIGDGDALAEDRRTLRDLGIPAAWTRRLRPGDRFTSILAVLDLPEVQISAETPVIAVVGPADVVQLEAHRTALDLPADGRPRQVVALPATDGKQRRNAIARAMATRPVVVAIPLEAGEDAERAVAATRSVQADAVIAIVDADQPLEAMTRFIESLDRVDAIALDGALEAEQPAAVLSLDVPVVRLDGISVDRIGWAALLCAQLAARDPQLLAQAG